MKDVLMVTNSRFPPDIRLEMEIASLNKEGYRIHVLHLGENDDTDYGINKVYKSTNKKTLGEPITKILPPINPILFSKILKTAKKVNPILIHAHDLQVVLPCAIVAKMRNIPCFFDRHENMPDAFKAWGWTRWYHPVTNNITFYKIIEWICLKVADKVIVISDEHKTDLLARGINPKKIILLRNLVDTDKIDKLKLKKRKIDPKHFKLTYVGAMGKHRGLDTLIESVPFAIGEIPNLKVTIMGGKLPKELQNRIKELGIEKYIENIGRFETFGKAMQCVKDSDVCTIPFNMSRHTNHALPHKITQYMYLEKPVIISNCETLSRIVKRSGSGVIFKADNPKDLARALIYLYKNKNLMSKMGKSGRKWVLKEYNWKKDSKNLINAYNKVK